MFRKIFTRSLIIFFTLQFSIQGNSFGQGFWQAIHGKDIPASGKRVIIPQKYKVFSVNQNDLFAFLKSLGNTPKQAATFYLPAPNGKKMAFRIWHTPIMPENLQKKYPEIRTFTAESVDNPYITAKIDYTNYGFHAMVYAPGHVWMIDPYSSVPDGYYISFYQADAPEGKGQQMACEINNKNRLQLSPSGTPTRLNQNNSQHRFEQKTSQDLKRVYRLALSCTGEYAVAVTTILGTSLNKSNVLSAMVTTLNRVNGIYEREIDVSLTLIPQEDTLIYLNPATDPFTANSNGGMLLGQNQQNTDNIIGTAGYDMGHIFSTGGGGIASLGSVCNSNRKAQGVTGLSNPTGDAFAVDYVAHEMGHQFGADHAFNDCDGNEYWRTAYEPGSGSTIMCYAGICGPQNDLQQHSDDYFHAISLTEISDYLAGFGNTCAAGSIISVPIPTFSSIQQNYVIPTGTPFELEAPQASSTNSQDSLSYCWEQWDLGNLQQPEVDGATFTTGPNLRSVYPKVANRVRVFPDLPHLVQNQYQTTGERLPLVARLMHFKLTVRNIENGWGAFNISNDSLIVQVVNTGQPFKVTSPDTTGLSFKADSSLTVTWNVAGTNNAPISCQTVDIYLSADSGYSYPYLLASDVPNTGQAAVIMANVNTNEGRIKVKGHDNIFFDISNNVFSTYGATPGGIDKITFGKNIKVYPNPATNEIHIESNNQIAKSFVLFNALGQKVWQGTFKKSTTIQVGNLSRGFYLLQISLSGTAVRTTKKIMLQ